ncbi:MAG: bis(5'-nucleosyl)-tetraphosphatase (symmetrical) YqeK [Lachnospiraceae bacterium]|nr:bis(5'-nucleosyl)-tetraphosphatase (symmetrical) YqeK [Lachnospiraceae bacterium]
MYTDDKFIYSLHMEMNKRLKPHRFIHSAAVAGTASALAMKYGEDCSKAVVAGILHDCAKCYDDDELVSLCKKKDIPVSGFEEEHGFILHAKYGAYLAKSKYGIEDEDILSAIRWHTTGHEDMTLLEKIVFVADYIEPLRNKASNLKEVRYTAFNAKSIDEAVVMIMHDTIEYLKEKGSGIDTITKAAYEFYNAKTGKYDE